MAARYPAYATQPEGVMAEALGRAIVDHAASASSVSRAVICESNHPPGSFDRVATAVNGLNAAFANRYGTTL
jgi:hypothetical protein